MAQNQQDHPLLIAVADANLFDEVVLVVAACGRDYVRVDKLVPTSAQFRRAPAIIVDSAEAVAAVGRTGAGAIIEVHADGDAAQQPRSDLSFCLPSQSIELVMLLGRSGPIDASATHLRSTDRSLPLAGIDRESAEADATGADKEPPRPSVDQAGAVTGMVEVGVGTQSAPGGEGTAIVVTSAVGGAGASTFAASVALALARERATCLIDADEYSGGADLLLGMEGGQGVTWSDLHSARGLLDAEALFQALPAHQQEGSLRVLTGQRHRGSDQWTVSSDALTTVIDSLVASSAIAIVDTPRHLAVTEAVINRADLVILVVPMSIRGVAAAGRLCEHSRAHGVEPLVVARAQRSRDIDSEDMAYALGTPISAELPYLKHLSHEVDIGGLSTSARRILQAADSLLDDLRDYTNPHATAASAGRKPAGRRPLLRRRSA